MLKAFVKLLIILPWLALSIVLLQIACWARISGNIRRMFILRSYRVIARVLGLRVRVEGKMSGARPLLVVTNHSSYLDILVLGAAEKVCFAPKAEIARWPIIGTVCRITGCVFIDRRPQQTRGNVLALKKALSNGCAVALFPEGTTSDGKRVLPFRSSYFALAEPGEEDFALTVQPATIRYERWHGLPIDISQRPLLAWYGDMTLLPHFMHLLRSGPLEVVVQFHPPILHNDIKDRKYLAKITEETVSAALRHLP